MTFPGTCFVRTSWVRLTKVATLLESDPVRPVGRIADGNGPNPALMGAFGVRRHAAQVGPSANAWPPD